MNPAVLCADPHHPLVLEIAQRFGIRPQLPEAKLTSKDGPVLLVQTLIAQPWRCDVGERLLLMSAPWHLQVPAPLPGTALLRHGPLISDHRHHDEAISLQRLLLWPYGDLTTQLAPQRPPWGHRVVHRYQSGHGAQRHPVPERFSLP